VNQDDFDREIRVQIPDNTIPTRIVFELPDGEQWGTASGSFNLHSGRGTYQLVQLPNRRDELRHELAKAAEDHREAQGDVGEALERLELTHSRLIEAARAISDYGQERGEVPA
jgi:hypothetical protein